MSFTSTSQCCPYIDNIEVIPTSPTIADNIKIATTVTTANQGMLLYSTHTMNGNTIHIEACYYSGLLPATQTYLDTLTIGMLSAGNYTIDFVAYVGADTICTYIDSNMMTSNFTVTEVSAGAQPITQQIGKLYPNPSNGLFTVKLPQELQATHIRILTVSGELVEQMSFTEQVNLNLATGMYLIEFLENDRSLGYQRFLIE